MLRTMLDVEGMSCDACVEHVTETLSIRGVSNVDVQLEHGTVEIEHAPTISSGRLIAALQLAGYAARPRRRS